MSARIWKTLVTLCVTYFAIKALVFAVAMAAITLGTIYVETQ